PNAGIAPLAAPARAPERPAVPAPERGHPPVTASPAASPPSQAAPSSPAAPPPGDGRSLKPALATDGDDPWSRISMYAALGLAAAGAGLWLISRRKRPALASSSIEVIAQRSLGGKARIVWLSAGP